MARTKITSSQVTPFADQAVVLAAETRNNSAFGDLTTVGPSVTVTIGANGLALVSIYSQIVPTTASFAGVGFVASGANTIGAVDDMALFIPGGATDGRFGATFLLTGLTPGATTFKLQYKSGTNTTFAARRIAVAAL
jgi:hypothetical protein